jgi:glycosyltransferase involved in cell wall biosynthesis
MQNEEKRLNTPLLAEPIRIIEQAWPEGTLPVVSVFCITYNHVNFIHDAIESFLMQETTFPVEIFIHDDASTDGTAKIVKEYAERYPKFFWTVYQNENQWSKGRSMFIDYFGLQKGKYIALCEGDDFWTCKDKLQKQFEYLETNGDCSGVFHRGKVVDSTKRVMPFVWDEIKYRNKYSQEECLKELKSGYPTASLFFRAASFPRKIPSYFKTSPFDFCLDLVLTESEKLGFMDFEGCAYRQHSGGIWSHLSKDKMQQEMVKRYLSMYCDNSFRLAYPEIELILSRQMEVAWWMIYKNSIFTWLKANYIIYKICKSAGFRFMISWALRKKSPVRYKALDLLLLKK